MRLLFQNLSLGSCFECMECIDELAELVFGLGDGDADISGSRKVVVAENIGFFVIDRGRGTRVLRASKWRERLDLFVAETGKLLDWGDMGGCRGVNFDVPIIREAFRASVSGRGVSGVRR
jgi:hypothetical protein